MNENSIVDTRDELAFTKAFAPLYLSLLVVINEDDRDERIDRIALISPNGIPDFGGLELWLKRRAVLACVQRDGMSFVSKNINKLRMADLAQLLLVGAVPKDHLVYIYEAVRIGEWTSEGLELNSVQAFIQREIGNIQ